MKTATFNIDTLDKFTRQYMETALWAETDNSDESGGEPFDANYSIENIAPETRQKMIEDCRKFQEQNKKDLDTREASSGGHDFWLTRCGHGAGFWDGDWEEEVGERLTKASGEFGNVDLCLGDDKLIYQM